MVTNTGALQHPRDTQMFVMVKMENPFPDVSS